METREESLDSVRGMDAFGAGIIPTDEMPKVLAAEQGAQQEMCVVLSDVFLEVPETIERIKNIFDAYETQPSVPSLFIFMGNFSDARVSGASNTAKVREGFARLADLVGKYERIQAESTFLFMPGMGDPGLSDMLPRYVKCVIST